MIDPSTPDLTARVLEMLGQAGRRVGDPAVDRAVIYMRKTQEADGSWIGRWGVNYIYGTWQALVGLAAVGVPASDPLMVNGANWLLAYQQPADGWGESPDSYADPSLRGQGPVTASQTAWAVLGLMAAGQARHPAVARGIRYLIVAQARRRHVGRARIYRSWFPARLLFALSPLPDLLPAHGTVALGERDWRRARRGAHGARAID